MSYVKDRKLKRRRHPTQQVTGAEAVARLNQVVDEANQKIALAMSAAQHWEQVATALAEENGRLRAALVAVNKAKTLGDARGIARQAGEEGCLSP